MEFNNNINISENDKKEKELKEKGKELSKLISENEKKDKNLKLDIWNETNEISNFMTNDCTISEESNKTQFFIRKKENNYITKKTNHSEIDFKNEEILFQTRKSLKNDNQYEIINPIGKNMKINKQNIKILNNKLWYIIKSENDLQNENEDYILNENDILKFGIKKYEIIKKNINTSKELYIDTENKKDLYNISQKNKKKGCIFDINIEKNQYIITDIGNNENMGISNKILNNTNDETNYTNNIQSNEKCRMCFGMRSTKDNPKLRLCECTEYIHYKCLKKYIDSKIKISENSKRTVKSYICHNFNCDKCLVPYPLRFKIKEYNKIYTLINYNDNIDSTINHIVLESLDYIKDGSNLKIVHVVKLNDDKIYIGRRKDNDIVDSDPFVSRKHAVLKYNKENGHLSIENRSGKFGTFVLIKDNIKIREKKICFLARNSFIKAYLIEKNESEVNTTNNNITNEFYLNKKYNNNLK